MGLRGGHIRVGYCGRTILGRKATRLRAVPWIGALLVSLGCTSAPWPPPDLRDRLVEGVSFTDLSRDPEAYKGRLVLLGGRVLTAQSKEYGIRLEILQLPLDEESRPIEDLSRSEGRFVVAYAGELDFAFGRGRRMSVIGYVARTISEGGVQYPLIGARAIQTWPGTNAVRLEEPQVLWPLTYPPSVGGNPR